MNEYCYYLPCLKDEEGSPPNLKCANVPFDDIKLSMIMLRAVPPALSTAYWAKMGVGHFPTNVKDVVKELLLIKPEYRRTQQIQDIVEKQISQKKTSATKPVEKHGEGKSTSNRENSSGKSPEKPLVKEVKMAKMPLPRKGRRDNIAHVVHNGRRLLASRTTPASVGDGPKTGRKFPVSPRLTRS